MNAPLRSKDMVSAPSLRQPVEAPASLIVEVLGMTQAARDILADYDGDESGFVHDCSVKCDGCGKLWFGGFGCQDVELNDFGRFTCIPCESRLDSLKAGSIWDDARADALSGRGA